MEELKAAWHGMQHRRTAPEEMRSLLRKHPARKGIMRQMVFEIAAFSVLLLVYYDFFDGHRKPFISNLLLAAALVMVIVHNLAGYFQSRNVLRGEHMQHMIRKYTAQLKVFAVLSVISRAGMFACLLWFFISGVADMTTAKWWMAAGAAGICAVQLGWLAHLWRQRIRAIRLPDWEAG